MSELLQKACQGEKQGNKNLRQQVRLIGNKFVNNVEISAQEAVYLLLQLSLKKCSREVVFISTSPSENRVYLLKSNIDELDDNDDDVDESNIIARYRTRPKLLDNVCLAEYVAYYDFGSGRQNDHITGDDKPPSEDIDAYINMPGKKEIKQ